jgi:hypothetical protein
MILKVKRDRRLMRQSVAGRRHFLDQRAAQGRKRSLRRAFQAIKAKAQSERLRFSARVRLLADWLSGVICCFLVTLLTYW